LSSALKLRRCRIRAGKSELKERFKEWWRKYDDHLTSLPKVPNRVTLVSCIMPTANRRRFVPAAIGMFLAQDYPEKELVILDDGEDAVEDLVPPRPELRYIRVGRRRSLGAKRNEACAAAQGDIILHWDDDDWYAPTRLRYQVGNLLAAGADLCGIDRVFFIDPRAGQAWEYIYPTGAAPWVHGATLCYRRDFWREHPFPEINIGEDTRFVMSAHGANIQVQPDNRFFVGLVHDANTSPKRVRDARWQPRSFQMIESIMRGEMSPGLPQTAEADGRCAPGPELPSASEKSALIEVCVGIHVHSEPERLAATLAQLKANSPSGIDILLLADGPDVATRAALARLTQYRQSATFEPRGAAACFNRLLRENDAEVLIFLESGCLVGPDWLDLILASLAADPRNGLAGPTTNSAWSLQGAFRDRRASAGNVAELAATARAEFGHAWRTLEPLYCLADFCYAMRRSVADAIGAADEEYGLGPCWEMDYTARAIRSGFQAVWAQGAYVFRHPFSARRSRDEAHSLETNKRRYQDSFCGLKLSGMRDGYARHCRGDVCPHFAPLDRIRRAIPLTALTIPARPVPLAAEQAPPSNKVDEAGPLVSCIMPTRDRLDWLLQSIQYFDRQDYPARELIIIDDGVRDLSSLLPRDPRIRYLKLGQRLSIGEKRNRACEAARGPIIVHWDDDDWYGPKRLSAQLTPILAGAAEITALQDTIFFDLDQWQFWKCSAEIYARLFVRAVHGGTLAFRREVFEARARYPLRSLAEDAMFLLAALRNGAQLKPITCEGLFAYIRHRGNSWRFVCGKEVDAKGWWQCEEPPFLRGDRDFYLNMSKAKPAHLVSRSYDLRTASLQPGGP
jgi:glycosyltransferase involved in cell wall biosynthesis